MQVSFPKINTNLSSYVLKGAKVGVNSSKLSPLKRDTVSFTGRAMLLSENMSNAPTLALCSDVASSAEPARFYLESVLNKYLGEFIDESDEKSTKKFPILESKTRIKNPISIREKVVSKYTHKSLSVPKKISETIYDELAKNFNPNPVFPREVVIKGMQRFMQGNDAWGQSLAANNISTYLSMAFSYLDQFKLFDFDSVPRDKQIVYYKRLKDILTAQSQEYLKPLQSPLNIDGIKHYANDIVGARIILRESDPSYTNVIIDALKQAVNNGSLKITSIENNIPDAEKLPYGESILQYVYASDAQLNSLANDSNSKLITNPSKSGYMAIHINLDLSNNSYSSINKKFDGYSGEIQIIGRDVAQLKEIEDICYKLKDNKNAIRSEYEPFKRHFLKFYTRNTMQAFDEYTYALYLAQRSIKYNHHRSIFPSLQIMGFDSTVPSELDFNTLKIIKDACEIEIKRHDSQNAELSPTQKRRHGKLDADIKEAKSKISYMSL